MEPPPAVPPVTTTTAPPPATQLPYAVAESVESSPRSRHTDSWDDHLPAAPGAAAKLRLMCSYGGHIVPRPHDKSLCYVGGDTRIVVVERHSSLADLTAKLSKTLLGGRGFTLKYQLPNEDLDSLISVTTDEDLENMVDEYDRTSSLASHKPSRLRLFLFASKPDSGSASSIGSLLDNSTKTEDWFLNALNGSGVLSRGGGSAFSDSQSYSCLLGLDDDAAAGSGPDAAVRAGSTESGKVAVAVKLAGQDVHSVPDSPMLETTSSFGSASSSPLLANLPPIRVHVEDVAGGGGVRYQEQKVVVGIEEHMSQMTVTTAAATSAVAVQKQDEGFMMLSPPPPIPTSIVPGATLAGSAPVSSEYSNRVFLDEERSEHRTQQPPPLQQPQFPQVAVPTQSQQRLPPGGGVELPSPDSVSSDSSFTNAMSRPKPNIYADPVGQMPSSGVPNRVSSDPNINVYDPNPRGQILQQLPDSGYVLTQAQYEQHQHQPQLQAQPQQYIHPGTHYVHHQVQPTGPVQIPSYYPVYPSQHQPQHHHPQLDQQYPFYFVSARPPAQPYNLSMQSKLSESSSTIPSNAPSNPAIVNPPPAYSQTRTTAPPPKPEMAAAGIYRTSAGNAGGSHLVQLPSGQHQPQYVGYSQIHHASQSIAPNSGAITANYAYEYADPNHAQIYYSQALPHQYQTSTSTPGMVLSDATSQLPADSVKQQQQIRSSQPL